MMISFKLGLAAKQNQLVHAEAVADFSKMPRVVRHDLGIMGDIFT